MTERDRVTGYPLTDKDVYHIDVSLGSLAGRYQWCIKDCRAEGGAQRGTETHSATIQAGGERGGTEGFGAGEICKWNFNYEDFHGLVFEVYKLYTSYCLPRMFWFVLRNSRKLFVCVFLFGKASQKTSLLGSGFAPCARISLPSCRRPVEETAFLKPGRVKSSSWEDGPLPTLGSL